MLELINKFFAEYESIAKAFYTFTLFIGACTAIAYRVHSILLSKKQAKSKELSEIYMRLSAAETQIAQIDQREVFQSGYLDEQERRFTEQNKTNQFILKFLMSKLKD